MSGFEGLLSGRTLVDRYRIEDVIGRGGFAVVYRATDERLERTVAIKVIVLTAPDAETREHLQARFHREARIAASLQHPNVVTVYDFGTDTELELDFLVMELLRGEDLSTRLRRAGPPALKLAVRIVRDAAWGLAAGHRAGMIHRDVKPGNIFLATQDRPGRFRVCVLDFGIAQIKVAAGDSSTPLTRGPAPLSPAYASPEQLRGERELSPAADVFSLGVVGYHLLAGERPFGPEQTDRAAALQALPMLRTRNPAVTPELEAVIHRALAFAPEDRFPDATAMGEALDSAYTAVPMGASEPVSASPPASSEAKAASPPGVPIKTRPAAAGRSRGVPARLWGAVGLATVAVLAALWAFGRNPAAEPQVAQGESVSPPPPAAPRQPEPGVSEPEVVPEPEPAPPRQTPMARAAPAQPGRQQQGVPAPAQAGRVASRPQPTLPARTVQTRLPAAGTPNRTPPPRVPPVAPVSSAPVRAPAPAPVSVASTASAPTVNRQGEVFFERGNHAAAVAHFRRAVQLQPNNPYYRNNLGWALLQAGQVDAAADELAETVRLDPQRAIAYANIGEVRLARGDTAGAIAAYERFLELNTNERREQIALAKVRRLRRAGSGP